MSVENYISKHSKWTNTLRQLRDLLLSTELIEEIKWGAPVYSINGKNVVGIGAFKNHCALWFFQGVFLEDKAKVLHNANEEKTKALRQIRFLEGEQIDTKLILNYIHEAIQNQKLGKELKPEMKKGVDIPNELNNALKADEAFKKAFAQFTDAKKREFAKHIAEAKREETKLNRIEKIKALVLAGQGLHDKYKNC